MAINTSMSKEIRFCGSVDEAPWLPGAYVMAIELAETIVVTLCGRAAIDLPAGRYLYCGSAKGPGGLKARLSRHMRRGKAMHWHIDQLTERGSVVGSWISPGGDECELVRRFTQLPIPIPGFGSSDCGKCRSHLLQWSNRTALPLLDAGISARRGGVRYACHRTEAPESNPMRHESSVVEDR
jgi:Uri superfamily endonuclease